MPDDQKFVVGKPQIESSAIELEILLKNYEWFHSVEVDGNRLRVYASDMSNDVVAAVPLSFYGRKVLLGLSAHKTCGEKYATGGSGKSVLRQFRGSEE